jgi:ATP-dependent DNA helicase RecQ
MIQVSGGEIIAENARIIVVGDDDQNIYSFRGSSARFMVYVRHEFECESYYLTT